MSFEQRDNSGALFKNDRKTSDNHPDYKGKIMVDGVEYWLSAWIKTPARGGDKFMSLAAQPKESQERDETPPPRQQPAAHGRAPARRSADLDDDIPFAPCVD